MKHPLSRREIFATSLLFITILILAFWTRSASSVYKEHYLPRMVALSILPDFQAIREKALIERVNIHIPNFKKLAEALHEPDHKSEAWGTCIQYHSNIIEAMPNHYDAWLVKGVCEYNAGDLASAEKSMLSSLAIRKDILWSHYNLGMLYYNNGAYVNAIKELKQVLELGQYYQANEWLSAKVISDIVRVDANRDLSRSIIWSYIDSLKALAAACFITNEHTCAREYAEAGIKLNPSDQDLLVIAGATQLVSGDPAQATQQLKEAIARNPDNSAAYFFMGMALRELKDYEGGVFCLAKSKKMGFAPNNFLSKLKFRLRVY